MLVPLKPPSITPDLAAILDDQAKMQQEFTDLKKRSAEEMEALRQENSRLRRRIEADPNLKGKAKETSEAMKSLAFQLTEEESEYNPTPHTFTTTQQTPVTSTHPHHFPSGQPGLTAPLTPAPTLPTTHIPYNIPTVLHTTHIPPYNPQYLPTTHIPSPTTSTSTHLPPCTNSSCMQPTTSAWRKCKPFTPNSTATTPPPTPTPPHNLTHALILAHVNPANLASPDTPPSQ